MVPVVPSAAGSFISIEPAVSTILPAKEFAMLMTKAPTPLLLIPVEPLIVPAPWKV